MSRRLLLPALIAAALVAGCGGDDEEKKAPQGFGADLTTETTAAKDGEYPKPVVENFMKSCTAQKNATKAYCECTLEELQEKLPYEDFKRADAAIQRGGKASPEAREAIEAAIKKCRK